jgi:hypothetical protein
VVVDSWPTAEVETRHQLWDAIPTLYRLIFLVSAGDNRNTALHDTRLEPRHLI